MPKRDDATLWLPGFEWTGAAPAPEPADIDERRRALDPSASFIVQAPAGSGKTELLIQRYLVLLARVAQPEAVVAITFTVKAAGEMRSRVLDALRRAAGGMEPAATHERATFTLARDVIERNAARGWDLLNNVDRLRIQTIDALSMAITRQMPWLARFGAMPEVVEDAREMYRIAARRAVETLGAGGEAGAAVTCLLKHLDNDAGRAMDLLARMLETRDHWLRVVGGGGDHAAARAKLEISLHRIVSEHLGRLYDNVPAYCSGELLELLRYAASNLQDDGSPIARCADLAAIPQGRPECIDQWLGLRRMLLTEKGEWRKRPDRRVGFPPSSGRMNKRMAALLASLQPAEEFRALLAGVAELPAAAYDDAQSEVLAALFRLLPVTVAHLRTAFAEAGCVDFIEIASAARRALGSEDQPTDLALTLGARIEHLLVDEFQDTSVTQFALLTSLTAGWENGDGRTLFLVGDPMQSIYRFRQAEVALFLNTRESGIGPLRPEPLALTVNFRSARTVVDWVNSVFREVLPAAVDANSGAVPYSPSAAFAEGSEGAAVTVHPMIGRDDRREADLVIELIERTRREMPGSRTAILVRARTHLAAIADFLRERGLPYRAIEIQALAEKPVIQDLVALTRALLHLADRVAWLSILRAPWCGLTLRDLLAISGGDRETTVWGRLHDPALALDADGARRVARIEPVLARALEKRGRVSVAQLVERAWIALGGDRIVDEHDLRDARVFFDLLEETGRRGDVGDLESLSRRVSELFANPDASAEDAVELMTIHKAKGLEFDTVILPGLGKRPKTDDAPLLVWSERPRGAGTDVLMAPVSARRGGNDRIYDFIRRDNEAKARHESERLLYVACTRAKTRLDLIGHVEGEKEPVRDSLLRHLWGAVRPLFDGEREKEAGLEPAAGSVPAPRMLRRIIASDTPEQFSSDGIDRPASVSKPRAAASMGTVTHRLLDRIAREGLAAWNRERIAALGPALRIALAAEGVGPDEMEAACGRAQSALVNAIDDPTGRWVLGEHAEARSEFAVSAVLGGELCHLVVDRTFVESGVRWIIDFKTSEPDTDDVEAFLAREKREYEEQLLRYAAALGRLDEREIRVGLYFPLLGRLINWQPEPPNRLYKNGDGKA